MILTDFQMFCYCESRKRRFLPNQIVLTTHPHCHWVFVPDFIGQILSLNFCSESVDVLLALILIWAFIFSFNAHSTVERKGSGPSTCWGSAINDTLKCLHSRDNCKGLTYRKIIHSDRQWSTFFYCHYLSDLERPVNPTDRADWLEDVVNLFVLHVRVTILFFLEKMNASNMLCSL